MQSPSDISLQATVPEHPLTKNLQLRIEKLTLEPDVLTANILCIRAYLEQCVLRDPEAIPANDYTVLFKLLPQLQQPALLLKDELMLQQVMQKLSLLPTELSLAKDHPIYTHLQNILKIYQEARHAWCIADDAQKKQLLQPKAELIGESLKPYYLSWEQALELLCRDRHGYPKKRNRYGNHPVAAKGGVHFKPNPVGRDYIAPGMEYAMYSFYSLLGGQGLAAPTTLLKIGQVWIEKILTDERPDAEMQAIETFRQKLRQGLDAEAILASDSNLQ